jgi:hypothetical protein
MQQQAPASTRCAIVIALGAFVVCSAGVAAKPRVRADCDSVRLAPGRQRLSQVLDKLSSVHTFRLENRNTEDPLVSHGGGNQLEVMQELSHQANLLVRYKLVDGCPGQWRLERVWVLPRELNAPVPVQPTAGLPTREQADAAAAKQSMDMYMRAHGMDPPASRQGSRPSP